MSAPTITAPATASGGVPVGGSGAAGYVAKWTAATTLGGSTTTGATASLYVDATGQVGVGTASPASKLDVAGTITCDDAGAGLKLPATPGNADAQTLDCYQDGGATAGGLAWTPTIGGTAADWGGVLPVVASAKYSRVGNLVFCSVSLTGAALIAAYGSTTITGPLAAGPAVNTSVPTSGGGNNGVGVQAGNTVYLPTIAGSTAEIRLNWFYAV